MKQRIRADELRGLTSAAREQRPLELARATQSQPNGELREVAAKIREYEQRHGMDSDTLRREVEAGRKSETWDICMWLMLLHERDRLGTLRTVG